MSRKRRQKPSAGLAGNSAQAQPTASELPFRPISLAGLSLLLAAAALVLYIPIASHPFVDYDDGTYITENSHIQSGLNWQTLRWAFASTYVANWHPLTWLVHAIDFQFFGLNAGGHHVVSMFLHAANVVLLFLVFAFVTREVGRSFSVAALFALHPFNVESTAWASELKNLLCTFFFLLCLGAYAWYSQKPGVTRFLLVVLLFACGLASKPMVITLPFVLLLLDFWPLRRVRNFSKPPAVSHLPQYSALFLVLEKLPLLALSAASAWVTIHAQSAWKATEVVNAPLSLRIDNALISYATYFWKTFLPFGLALYYPFPVHGIPLWQTVISAVLLLALSAFVFWNARRQPYLVTGWCFFLGTLVPVLGILQVGGQAHADRYMYMPIIGLLFSAVWSFSALADAKKISRGVRTGTLLFGLAALYALSARQLTFWHSSYDLWTRSISVTRDNAFAEHILSMELIRSGRTAEVFPHLRRAVELNPNDFASRVNLGNAYSSQGQEREALEQYTAVMEGSDDPRLLLSASINAGSSYRKLGDLTHAEAAYRQALRVSPDNPPAVNGLDSIERARASAPGQPQN